MESAKQETLGAVQQERIEPSDPDALERLVRGLPTILNVIPYNATRAPFRPPTWA